ncbi:MAG TPA: hypothetical protein VLH75_12050 [Longimicrobiales bacterium]|nr:hypothetical protein [Longimicrobiales bacterium]
MLLRRHLRSPLWSPRWDQAYGFVLVGRAEIEAGKEGVVWSRFLDDACRFAQAEGADAGAIGRCAERLAALAPAERGEAAARLLRFRYPPVLRLGAEGLAREHQEAAIRRLHRPGTAVGLARNPQLTPGAVVALGTWLRDALSRLELPSSEITWDDLEAVMEVAGRLGREGWLPPGGTFGWAPRLPHGTGRRVRQRDALRILARPLAALAHDGGSGHAAGDVEAALLSCGRALPAEAVEGVASRGWPSPEVWLRLLAEAPTAVLFDGLPSAWPAEPEAGIRRILDAIVEEATGPLGRAYPFNLVGLRRASAGRPDLAGVVRSICQEHFDKPGARDILWPLYLDVVTTTEHLVAVAHVIAESVGLMLDAIDHPLGGAAMVVALVRPGQHAGDLSGILEGRHKLRCDPTVREAILAGDSVELKLLLLEDRMPAEYPVLLPLAAAHEPLSAIEVLEEATADDLRGVAAEALAPLFTSGNRKIAERAMRCLGKVG